MFRVVFAVVCVVALSLCARGASYSGIVLYQTNGPTGELYYDQIRDCVPGQSVGVGNTGTGSTLDTSRALVWTGPSSSAVDLTPASYKSSFVYSTCGTQQAGFGYIYSGGNSQPLIWSGTAGSFNNLLPTGSFSGAVSGTNRTQQVGYVTGPNAPQGHATLWTGSAGSAVDLNPTNLAGYSQSTAIGIYQNQQVGNGYGSGTSYSSHALLWYGSASTAVDLNPTNFSFSSADAICGTQQVGYGNVNGSSNAKALLWSGTADSAVNLSPNGFQNSYAESTNGQQQVGYANNGATAGDIAVLWSGSALSMVNLQSDLPTAGSWTASRAYYIDTAGNIYGTASGTFGGIQGDFAVEWPAVPEPTGILVAAVMALGLAHRRAH